MTTFIPSNPSGPEKNPRSSGFAQGVSTGTWLQRFANHKIHLSWLASVGFALLCVALATLARLLMGWLIGTTVPFAFYFPAVLFATLFGGTSAGLTAILFSMVVAWWAFTPPYFAFTPFPIEETGNFVVFAAASLFIAWLAIVHRRLLFKYEQQEQERALLVGEMQHRGRNILAVVETLIRHTSEDADKGTTLINRIRATISTQDLLESAPERKLSLRDLLNEELLKPYGSRVKLEGPQVTLSASTSRALRLVFHEMATNALKHGALSEPNGKVTVDWALHGHVVTIDWCEMDGPKTAAPTKYNFGSKLINQTLKQMKGKLEPTFAETGYCYKITIPIEAV